MNPKRHLWILMLGMAVCGRCIAAPTNALAKTDFAYFKPIPDRNIFNPNRMTHDVRTNQADSVVTPPIDAFALVGTMTYEKGTFAFFSGPKADYQKVLQRNGEIAGFTLSAIKPDAVILANSNSTIEVQVGAQLQRDAAAGWRLVTNIMTQTTYQVTAPATLSSAGDVGGPASDVLKKMMQKREQELQ